MNKAMKHFLMTNALVLGMGAMVEPPHRERERPQPTIVRTLPHQQVFRDNQEKKRHRQALKLRKRKGHKYGGGRR